MRGYRYRVDDGGPAITTAKATVATSGEHVVTWGAQDVAGNVETTKSIAFKVDVDAPKTAVTLTGDRGDAGFYRSPVSIALTATDGDSGVDHIVAAVDGADSATVTDPLELTESGTHKVVVRAYDRAGNAEAPRTLTVVIDRTAPSATASATTPGFSPNGDGASDAGRFGVSLSEPGTVRATITDHDGTVVRTFEAKVAATASLGWDGRDDDGIIVPDGSYSISLVPVDRAGNAGDAVSVTLRVYGAFVGGLVEPARFFPQDGDAVARTAVFRATLRSGATVRLEVLTSTGTVIRTVTKDVPAGAVAIGWDGKTDAGAFAAQGRYTFRVTASNGSLAETKRFTVIAAAFDIRTSVDHGPPRPRDHGDDRERRAAGHVPEARRPSARHQPVRGHADARRAGQAQGDLHGPSVVDGHDVAHGDGPGRREARPEHEGDAPGPLTLTADRRLRPAAGARGGGRSPRPPSPSARRGCLAARGRAPAGRGGLRGIAAASAP